MKTNNLIKRLLATFALALLFIAPALADDQSKVTAQFSAEQAREFEGIIRNYLLSHPEVIVEAMQKLQDQEKQAEDQRLSEAAKGVKPVVNEDHIRGNANAPVKVVEFSDFECPFCKSFHASMKQVMNDYEKDGKVAWVYRHFPLDQIHSKARKEAQAAECAAELGGNTAFWTFADELFEIAPSNNRLDLTLLPKIAEGMGLDKAKFETCLEGDQRGGKFATHIEANLQDAMASGGTGTPYSLVISSKGHIFPINGAMPYEAVKAIIDAALKED
jgi:protein-disulfide isomerase